MGFSNNMTDLVNKIEQVIGTEPLTLPDHLSKSIWPDKVIIPMTIVTYSRYFPNRMRYHIDGSHPMKNGWYLLDESIFNDAKILGVTNVDWGCFNGTGYGGGYGYNDATYGAGIDDIANIAISANLSSMFNNKIYPTFEPPNKFRLETANGRSVSNVYSYDLYVLVEHSPSLLTISATQMDTFDDLACCDVARFLYNNLKYYDNIDTVFANTNIRLDDILERANKRDEIMAYIKENYVSAANKNQPMILCI